MLRALAGVAAMSALEIVRVWLAVRPVRRVKRWRERRKAKRRAEAEAAGGEFIYDDSEGEMFKGKLTYSGIAVLVLTWALERYGVPMAPEEVEAMVTAGTAVVGGLLAVYGRYRATKDAE